MYIKTLIVTLFFLTIGVFNVHAQSGQYFTSSPFVVNFTVSASSTMAFNTICRDNIVIKRVYQRTASQTAGTVLTMTIGSQSVATTTTSAAEVLAYDFNVACNSGESLASSIVVTSGDNSYVHYRFNDGGNIGNAQQPWNRQVVNADRGEAGYIYALGFEYDLQHVTIVTTGSSSEPMATTTVLTQNDSIMSFFLLYAIFLMTIVFVIWIFRPFYARK